MRGSTWLKVLREGVALIAEVQSCLQEKQPYLSDIFSWKLLSTGTLKETVSAMSSSTVSKALSTR